MQQSGGSDGGVSRHPAAMALECPAVRVASSVAGRETLVGTVWAGYSRVIE